MNPFKLLKQACVAGLFCFSMPALAQNAYIKLGGGYHFGIGGNIYNNVVRTIYAEPNRQADLSQELVRLNYGKGISFGGSFGYKIREQLALELGIHYLIGGKNEIRSGTITYDPNSPKYPEPHYNLTTTQSYARTLLLQPGLVIQGTSEHLNPYARIGLVMSTGKIHNVYHEQTAKDLNQTTELSGGFGLGFQGALGATLRISEKLKLFAEGTFSNLHYAPEKGEVTSRNLDGQDNMFMLSKSEVNFQFEEELEYHGNNNNPGINQHLKTDHTFSNAGLGLGLLISF